MSNGSGMPEESTENPNPENPPSSDPASTPSTSSELEIFGPVQEATQNIAEKVEQAEEILLKASNEAGTIRGEVKKLDDNVAILKKNTEKLLEGVGALSVHSEPLSAPPSKDDVMSAPPDVLAAPLGSVAQSGIEVAKKVQDLGFAEFTKGLIDGTFDAVVGATIKQIEAYSKLLQQTTQSLNDFYTVYKDTFDAAAQESGGTRTALQIAEERQNLLKDMVRLGMARVVIDSGEIETKLTFNVTTNESETVTQKRENTNTNITKASGGVKFLWWGVGGGTDNTNVNVSVDNTDKVSSINTNTDIMGRVKINFRTDYFPAVNTNPADEKNRDVTG
jgi:hypothetical protein